MAKQFEAIRTLAAGAQSFARRDACAALLGLVEKVGHNVVWFKHLCLCCLAGPG
jgi:hypothetical protein